jgi:hypothetical protein
MLFFQVIQEIFSPHCPQKHSRQEALLSAKSSKGRLHLSNE